MDLSIIVPLYNEENTLEVLFAKIQESLKQINYQIIFINDGSSDSSSKVLKKIYNKDLRHVKVIEFSRNFGKDAAIYAGLKYAKSKYTAIIDADLQQNPKYLYEMYNFLEKNQDYDGASMVIKKRNGNIIKNIGSKFFYKIINILSDINFAENASDFRMFRENIKEAILTLDEKIRFSKGIFNWIGFKTKYFYYDVEKRYAGISKFNLKKSINYAMNGIVNYSAKPLKVATFLGILASLLSFTYLIYIIIKTIFLGVDTPGFATLACLILFTSGVQLTCIGILGEYLGSTFTEVKNRPIYIIKSKDGF